MAVPVRLFETLLDERRPRTRIADLRRVQRTGRMTGGAHALHDLLARTLSRLIAPFDHDHFADRLQAFGDRLLGRSASVRLDTARDEAREHRDEHDRHDERQNDDDRELFGRLDERRMLVVRVRLTHWDSGCGPRGKRRDYSGSQKGGKSLI